MCYDFNTITPSDRQLTDAAGIHAVQAGNLDLSYLRRLASDIGVTSKLEEILGGKIGPKIT